ASFGTEMIACMSFVQEGMIGVKNDEDKWGFANKDGEIKIKPKYSSVNYFSEGLAVVKDDDNDKTLVIDKDGKTVFTLKEDYHLLDTKEFHYGKLAVKDKDKDFYGFLNKKGEFTKVNGKVEAIGDYNDDYFVYCNEETEWGVKDMKGENVIKAKYDGIVLLSDGNFFVTKTDGDKTKCSVINKKGEEKVSFDDWRGASPFNDNFKFIGCTKSKYVLLNGKGEQVNKDDDSEFANINYELKRNSKVYSDYSEAKSEEAPATEEVTEVWEEQPAVAEGETTEDYFVEVSDLSDMTFNFTGSIGKYPIVMELTFSDLGNYDYCEVTGRYYYKSSGAGNYLTLYGVKAGDQLNLVESTTDGNVTGTFEGSMTIIGRFVTVNYTGKFTNSKGTTFNFDLTTD
ncbi:MAG: WG repeat-containing protein, partial [Muribaculaceae bacterium]|nr:WG repeat-containing protein [Muribaculaceae bacterium]